MLQHKRLFVSLGATALALVGTGAVILNDVSAPPESIYMTSGPTFKDVAELTRASDAVAHVRVVQVGKSYVIPFDPPVVTVAPPPPKTGGPKDNAQATSAQPAVPPTETGVLKTDVTVEVLDAVRAGPSQLHTGDRLLVAQLGGTDEQGNRTVTEDDPLLQVGDQEIMFLRHGSGKFFTTGGGQGRFKVHSNGTVTAVDHESQIGRLHNGKPASFLKSSVEAVR